MPVNVHVIENGPVNHIVELTNTGETESGVVKVDRATLKNALEAVPDSLTVWFVNFDVQGFTSVTLEFERAGANDPILHLGPHWGKKDYCTLGGIKDPNPGDGTGNIAITTAGTAGTYSITLHVRY